MFEDFEITQRYRLHGAGNLCLQAGSCGIAEWWQWYCSTMDQWYPGMGLSENVMYPYTQSGFADHYPHHKWLFHWGYTPFSDTPSYRSFFRALLGMIKCIYIYIPKKHPHDIPHKILCLHGKTGSFLCHAVLPRLVETKLQGLWFQFLDPFWGGQVTGVSMGWRSAPATKPIISQLYHC